MVNQEKLEFGSTVRDHINEIHNPVALTEPMAPWLGGKSKMAKKIGLVIDAIPHMLYAEPFIGMGGVFLRRDNQPKIEVLNDYSRDISSMFRVIQRHKDALIEYVSTTIHSRDFFDEALASPQEFMTDIERAIYTIFKYNASFGGRGQHFGMDNSRGSRFKKTSMIKRIEALHDRLEGVILENNSYEKILHHYNKPYTLFYLDPPYFGNEEDYGKHIFFREDFIKIADILSKIKGKFIMSINQTPEIRVWYNKFFIYGIDTVYSINSDNNNQEVEEFLVTNVRIDHLAERIINDPEEG